MKRRLLAGAGVILVVMGLAAASPAATIQEVLATQFDPTRYDFRTSGFGLDGYYLTWDNILFSNDAFGQHYASEYMFNDLVDQA